MNKTIWLPLLICLMVVLALLVAHGNVPGAWRPAKSAERAYATYQSARDLRGLQDLGGPHSPLFLALLAGVGRLGLSIPQAGMILSVAGWLASIIAVYWIGLCSPGCPSGLSRIRESRLHRPVIAIFAAAALTLEPMLYQMLGQDALFVMGWLWVALCGVIPSAKGRGPGPKREESFPRKQDSALYPTPPLSSQLGITVSSVLALVVLAASMIYHAVHVPATTLWESYGPALIPALALLAGLLLDKLVALTVRLPFAWRSDERFVFEAVLVALALLGLGYARGTAQAWSIAPREAAVERLALWEQAGLWLQKNTPLESTVWSEENGVLGYFSARRIVNTASPDAPPDYCAAVNSLAWKEQISRPWFQEHYRRVTAIANPYDSLAPLTIYRYRPSPFDVGPVVDVGARFGEAVELESFRLDSTQLIPGEAQHLTLTWRALQPLPKALNARVRLYDSARDRVWAQVDDATPANIRTQLWPVSRPMTDHYTLEIPDDLPAGAYQIEVQMLHAENEVMPGTNIEHPLGDTVTLARLEAQPWTSDTPLTAAQPLTATFGDAIQLTGYSVSARVDRGAALRVRLYWHALATPSASYHVFTHLLTADNRLVAQQDSAPVFETYPTSQWQAGQYILDEHLIPIDAATPPGRYWLKVGLYLPESGERLTVRDQAGREMPDQTRSVPLIQVDVE